MPRGISGQEREWGLPDTRAFPGRLRYEMRRDVMEITVLFISLLVLLVMGVPIMASLLGATVLAAMVSGQSVLAVVQRYFGSVDSFSLLAVPFFMLSGTIMEKGGVSKRLIQFISLDLDKLPGGLAIVTIVASTFFGAISGSAPATVAAIGGIMLPAMLSAGYEKGFALATIATAGCLGSIIPPSIMMVNYGVSVNESIGDLFLAGIFPGILLCLVFSLYAFLYGKKHQYYLSGEQRRQKPWKVRLQVSWDALPALFMPVIILGGIYGGIFTPSEAGNVAAVYGLLVGFFLYKELKLQMIPEICVETLVNTSMIMVIMGAAGAFGSMLAKFQVTTMLAECITGFTDSPVVFLLLFNILMLLVGTFMEANAAIILIAPLLAPVAQTFGIDLLFFGIIMVINIVFGLLTPPVGINLYVACGIKGYKMKEILKKPLWCYLGICLGMLLIFTYVPGLTLFLFQRIRG